MRRLLTALVSGTALMAAVAPASALSIGFDFAVPGDGSAKTSVLAGDANVFVETFDGGAQGGCGLVSTAFGVSVSGDYMMLTGNHSGVAANPAGDSTCYASAPSFADINNSGSAHSLPASVTVDFAGALTGPFIGDKIDYLGYYWGSIDAYNSIDFFDGDTLIRHLEGQEILNALGGAAGNQVDDKSNVYVNLYFDANEYFTKFVMTTTGVAMEIDNVAIRVADVNRVPEPATLGLMGAGLVGFGLARRRKAAK